MSRMTHVFLADLLLQHRPEIVDEWELRLDITEKFTMFRLAGDFNDLLMDLLEDLDSLLRNGVLRMPSYASAPVPINVPKFELHILLTGEDVCGDILRRHRVALDGDWMMGRRILNESFHSFVKRRLPALCECCAWTIASELAKVRKLEGDLENLKTSRFLRN